MEKKENKPKKRASTATVRKSSHHGTISQKMMTFRIDLDIATHLETVPNKGRLINELLRQYFNTENGNK